MGSSTRKARRTVGQALDREAEALCAELDELAAMTLAMVAAGFMTAAERAAYLHFLVTEHTPEEYAAAEASMASDDPCEIRRFISSLPPAPT